MTTRCWGQLIVLPFLAFFAVARWRFLPKTHTTLPFICPRRISQWTTSPHPQWWASSWNNLRPIPFVKVFTYTWVGQAYYLSSYSNFIIPSTLAKAFWPLFILQNGRMLTHQIFSNTLDGLLEELHFKKQNFNTHSFCIGAATSAKAANISDMHIQMLGRCKSNAYKLYIQTPPQEIANLSRVLAAAAK